MNSEYADLKSIRDWVRWAMSQFEAHAIHFGHSTGNALDEAVFIVSHALHLGPELPEVLWDARLTRSERERVLDLVQQRVEKRIPSPYLTGRTWFAGLQFAVDQRVLIPRSPIAELIENGFRPWIEPEQLGNVLDLCTGSGCIGLAVAHYLPHVSVDLVDVDESALTVAAENRRLHRLEDRTELIRSDLFEHLSGRRYDLIISNPPYVSEEEFSQLPDEYGHEPRLGLHGGDDGLDIVRRILIEAGEHLEPEGMLVVEVGSSAATLADRYPDVPFLWLEFERGGEGVFLLTARQLADCRGDFMFGLDQR